MHFSERAEFCRIQRLHGAQVGFRRNHRGILQKGMLAEVIIKAGHILQQAGEHMVFYTEQDPNGKEQEAQLVQMGIWKQKDVGWLWIKLPDGTNCKLAKVTPREKIDLNPGWITERGVYVIDADFAHRIQCSD